MSRMTRLIIPSPKSFMASKNQFQLAILEFGYLGHRIGSFSPTQHKHKSVKLPAIFDQNPPKALGQIVAKHIPMKK